MRKWSGCTGTIDRAAFRCRPHLSRRRRLRDAKGWNLHRQHDDRYCLLTGEMALVLYDPRPSSPTCGQVCRIIGGGGLGYGAWQHDLADEPARPRGDRPHDPARSGKRLMLAGYRCV